MKSFLKYTLATLVGIFISFFIFIIFLIALIAASSKEKPVEVKPNTILYLRLNQTIVDRTTDSPLNYLPVPGFAVVKKTGLNDILDNISKAKTDDRIKGIYMELSLIPAGMASIEEIRNALIDFKKSGKFIISYGDFYYQKAYYLASVSDKVYLNPSGQLLFVGLGTEILFYKRAFNKLGIEAQVIRHGEYKSAVEPYTNEKMSQENREQIMTWVGSIWEHILEGISEQRKIPVDQLNKLADNLEIKGAQLALENKLVDGLKYKDEIINELKELTNTELKKDLNSITLRRYTKVPKKRDYKGLARNKVAVIYAQGDVIIGNTGEGTIASERISKAIRMARRDSTIKAIVFRVNSGGGAALASEVIWREIDLAKEVKPVVASIGDVAASGGYYILAPADTIVASPISITGSIGVFAILPNLEKFFGDKLGITVDVAKTNQFSDLYSIFRPLTDEEKDAIKYGVQKTYNDFLYRVSKGRNMTSEEVDDIGKGRVWSGVNAMENGLIDIYGGLHKSIEIAAGMAGLDKYRVVSLPKLEDPLEQLIRELTENVKYRLMKNELGDEYKYLKTIQQIKNFSGIQARIPYQFEIH